MSNTCDKIKRLAKENYGYLISFIFLLFCLIYVLIKKDNIYIQLWDNLDSNIAWLKMLKDNNAFFDLSARIPFLGGIDRKLLYSPFNVYPFLYYVFPSYVALVVGWFLKVITSVVCMSFLGLTLFEGKNKRKIKNIFALCGLLYSLTATFPTAAISFATLPFVFAIVIKLYRQYNIKYFVILFIYPITSDLVIFGAFICGYILLFFAVDYIKNKKPKLRMLMAVLVLSIGYVLVNYNLIHSLLFGGGSTIRSDGLQTELNYDFYNVIKSSIEVFLNGANHVDSAQKYFILPISIIYMIYLLWRKIVRKRKLDVLNKYYVCIFAWIIFNCVICGLDSYGPFKFAISRVFPFLYEFSFARSIWFNPFLWCLLLALIMVDIEKEAFIVLVYTISMMFMIVSNSRYNVVGTNIRKEIGLSSTNGTELTYREFYSSAIFDEIKRSIGYKGEWAIAYGMHPAIIEYNGIHTLDGYLSYYPLDYNKKFRKIIEPELKIDKEHREYYDNWGGRAYIFSLETHYYTWKKEYKNKKANLYINTNAFKDMDGKYIFSRVEIVNYKDMSLQFVDAYNKKDSPYTIYVYSVK